MIQILQVTGNMNRGGAETMILNLYREIDRSQCQFDFIVFSELKGDYDDEIIKLGGQIHVIKASNSIRRMLALKHFLLQNPQYQIIHCHTNFSNAFHLFAAKQAGVRMRIAHSHNTIDHSRNKLVSFFYHRISKYIINRAATNFLSCGVKASNLLFPSQKDVLVIPNSIDVYNYADISLNQKNYIKYKFKHLNAKIKINQIERMQTEKNYKFSIEIAKELKIQGVNFIMFFIGRGELKDALTELISRYNLENQIIFLGLRSDIAQLVAGADIMLMPSLYEGFPVVLVESQAAGLPALISDTISSEVDLGVNSIFFESLKETPEKWVNQIVNITMIPKISIHERSRILIDKGFDTKINAKKLIKFYNQN